MRKLLINLLIFLPCALHSQIIFGENAKFYNSYDNPTSEKFVSASWKPGIIILADDTEIEGEVKGYTYKGSDINSFRYRPAKGEKATTYKAEDCKMILYDGLRILSLPKKLKKMTGKNRFYVALYYGEYLTVFQDPDANTANSASNEIILNEGQMLSFLAIKSNEVSKITAMSFRKQIRKLCADNEEWVEKSQDKKWLKYENMYEIVDYYNKTRK